jgi:hypothetical protein
MSVKLHICNKKNSKKIKEQNIMQYLFVILIKLCTFANTLLK